MEHPLGWLLFGIGSKLRHIKEGLGKPRGRVFNSDEMDNSRVKAVGLNISDH
jgi:hypothetical protein